MTTKNRVSQKSTTYLQSSLIIYGFFIFLAGLIALSSIIFVEDKLLMRSFSPYRMALAFGILLGSLFFGWVGTKSLGSASWANRFWKLLFSETRNRKRIFWVIESLLLLSWTAYFVPKEQLPENISGYVVSLHPVFGWSIALQIATMVLVIINQDSRPLVKSIKSILLPVLVFFVVFFCLFIVVIVTGMGIRYPEDYWYGAGMPILVFNILFMIIIASILVPWDIKSHHQAIKFDLMFSITLWLVTAFLWAKEPLRTTYFLPTTSNNPAYPFSDSATFDIGSQYTLIGQGMFNGEYFDRALYSTFLVILHVVGGQETVKLMTLQAVILAVLPVIVYLIGKEIQGRALGVVLGILILLRGINSIAGSAWLDAANPKMMTTDFPCAIGVTLFILYFIKWMKKPESIILLCWAGCSLGLTIMLRSNVLLLIPVAILFIFIILRNKKTFILFAIIVLITSMTLTTLPWELRNHRNNIPPFYTYYFRIQQILRARYGFTYNIPPTNNDTAIINNSLTHSRYIGIERESDGCNSRLCKIGNHFLHNTAMSILILPTTLDIHNLPHTAKGSIPYWQQYWTGNNLNFVNYGLILLNLIIISIGIGISWSKYRWIGIFPLAIFWGYLLSNSLAFTSGGRYIAPVDWIIIVYYATGILQLINWLLRIFDIIPLAGIKSDLKPVAIKTITLPLKNILITFCLILFIGSIIPLSEMPFQKRYNSSFEETLVALDNGGWLKNANLSSGKIQEFLKNPHAIMLTGRALYPRTYPAGKGELGKDYPYLALDYSRLVFQMIGPENIGFTWNNIILAGGKPKRIPHASDVVVLGCKNQLHIDAILVFILSESQTYYARNPNSGLTCP